MRTNRVPSCYAKAMAASLGINIDQPNGAILSQLRKVPASKIAKKCVMFKDYHILNPLPWKPVVDNYSSDPFLPEPFEDLLRRGEFDKTVTVLAGTVANEGLIFTSRLSRSPAVWPLVFEDWNEAVPIIVYGYERDIVTDTAAKNVLKIKQRYFPNHMDSTPAYDKDNKALMEAITTMAVFKAPLQNDIDILTSHGVKVNVYEFNYNGSSFLIMNDLMRLKSSKLIARTLGKHVGLNLYSRDSGVCHGEELPFVFAMKLPGIPKCLKSARDKSVSKLMVSVFANFAIDDKSNDSVWPAYNRSRSVLVFNPDGTTKIGQGIMDQESFEFFNQIFKNLQQDPLSDEPVTQIFKRVAHKRQ